MHEQKVIDPNPIFRETGIVGPRYGRGGEIIPPSDLGQVVKSLHNSGVDKIFFVIMGSVARFSDPRKHVTIPMEGGYVVGEAPHGSQFGPESKNPGYYVTREIAIIPY